MTKIMCWNIEKFTASKITSQNTVLLNQWLQKLQSLYKPDIVIDTQLALKFISSAAQEFPLPSNSGSSSELYNLFFSKVLIEAAKMAVTYLAEKKNAKQLATDLSTQLSSLTYDGNLTITFNQVNSCFVNLLKGASNEIEFVPLLQSLFEQFQKNLISLTFTNEFCVINKAVQSLQVNKPFSNTYIAIQKEIATLDAASQEGYTLAHIINNINAKTLPPSPSFMPDILVILEVLSETKVEQYDTIVGKGAEGIIMILNNLRKINPNYCLVPPVRLAKADNDLESIAVFYDAAKLKFMGPQTWNDQQAIPLSTTSNTDYSSPWQTTPFPSPPTQLIVNGNTLPNRTVEIGENIYYNEYQLAGQCIFPQSGSTNGAIEQFCGPYDRPPLLTVFQELTGAERTIKLVAMHATQGSTGGPGTGAPNAPAAVKKLNTLDCIKPTGRNEVGVIVGDFNVQLLIDKDKAEAYGDLTNNNYVLVFDNTKTDNPNLTGTTLKKQGSTTGTFPFYGYMKNNPLNNNQIESLDNILVNLGTAFCNAMILNRVVGVSPSQAASFNSSQKKTFGYSKTNSLKINTKNPYGYVMANSIEDIIKGNTKNNQIDNRSANVQFCQLENYGKIQATSDHMALVIEI